MILVVWLEVEIYEWPHEVGVLDKLLVGLLELGRHLKILVWFELMLAVIWFL